MPEPEVCGAACQSALLDRDEQDNASSKRAVTALCRIWEKLSFRYYPGERLRTGPGATTLGKATTALIECVAHKGAVMPDRLLSSWRRGQGFTAGGEDRSRA